MQEMSGSSNSDTIYLNMTDNSEANAELSYDELMDIIVNNKPVPNVIDVPDIVLDQSLASEAHLQPRLKPWEKVDTVPVMGGLVRQKEETRGLVQNVEQVKKSNSLEKLTNYYALEAEFQKQLKSGEILSTTKSADKSANSLLSLKSNRS